MKVRFMGTKREMQDVREHIKCGSSDDETMTVSKMHPNRNDPDKYRMYVYTDRVSSLFGE